MKIDPVKICWGPPRAYRPHFENHWSNQTMIEATGSEKNKMAARCIYRSWDHDRFFKI